MVSNHTREIVMLREQLVKRLRFAWAMLFFGILIGIVLTIICTMPPVTFGPEVWS